MGDSAFGSTGPRVPWGKKRFESGLSPLDIRHTIQTIAERVEGEVVGSREVSVVGLEALERAGADQLTFIGDARHARRWGESGAGAALVTRGLEPEPTDQRPLIFVDSADLAMARILELFAPDQPQPAPGVHESAVVDPAAELGEAVCIGPGCYVGPGAVIGDRCVLHAHVVVHAEARLGAGCTLWSGTVVRERCVLGRGCICHPNVVIGADGFGYRPAADGSGPVKIPHIGTVELGDEVELGAGTCVDRGKFAATVIGSMSKIDNLVQIGHNCDIGRAVLIAGHTGIAGSVSIGDGAVLGGMVAVRDHVTIGARAQLAGASQLMHDVPAGEAWAGIPAQPVREAAEQAALVRKLPELVRQLKKMHREGT